MQENSSTNVDIDVARHVADITKAKIEVAEVSRSETATVEEANDEVVANQDTVPVIEPTSFAVQHSRPRQNERSRVGCLVK